MKVGTVHKHRIKSPLDGVVKITVIRQAFLEHLGLIPVLTIGREASKKPLIPTESSYKHRLYLLSPIWNTETVKHEKLIAKYGGREPYRLMAILEFGEVFSAGFRITIFGKDIKSTLYKKIARFQDMLSGNGCPAFVIEVNDNPHFVPLA